MSRRQPVPPVEYSGDADVLEGLLRSPELAPVYDRNLQPLAGIRWQGLGTRRVPVAGEVAMFDVADGGELQEW